MNGSNEDIGGIKERHWEIYRSIYLFFLVWIGGAARAHVKVGTQAVCQPDWLAVIVINHYQVPQITVDQSSCDTQLDVPTLTCAPGAHSVDESGFEKIVGATTTKATRETLEKVHKGADQVKQVWLQPLRGELEAMKMKEPEGVSDYITRVHTMVKQLTRNGETLTDSRVVEKILRLLTDKFENVFCAIEDSKDIENITINDLAISLEAHEQRKLKKKQESLDVALQTNMTVKDIKEEKAINQPNFNKIIVVEDAVVVEAVVLIARVVNAIIRGVSERATENHKTALAIIVASQATMQGIMTYEVDGTVMMANEEVAPEIDTIWYLDTAASNHMYGDKLLLVEMKEVVDERVAFGDESKVRMKGRATP
ncbi:hypothetical protein Tco_0927453 [Tanacetum coccineum]